MDKQTSYVGKIYGSICIGWIITILVSIALITNVKAEEPIENIIFSIESIQKEFVRGEPIIIKIHIENKGKQDIKIEEPSIDTKIIKFNLTITDTDKVLPPQLKWQTPYTVGSSAISVEPNKGYETEFDLLDPLFPLTIKDGDYKLDATYIPSEGKILKSNRIELHIKPFPKQEEDALNEYIKILRGDYEAGIKFVKKYPQSLFINQVRNETGFALAKLKRYDEAMEQHQAVIESSKATKWQKREATFRMAFVYHDKGDINKAMELLDQYSTIYLTSKTDVSYAKSIKDGWIKEKKDKDKDKGKDDKPEQKPDKKDK
jgi:tetratricopeptide (TPR) repeat protein